MNQHQPLLHTIPPARSSDLGVPHQVERAEPFTADSSLRVNIAVNRTVFGPRKYQDKPILLDVTPADPQTNAGTPVRKQC